jgi:hypothetical protein
MNEAALWPAPASVRVRLDALAVADERVSAGA